MLTALALAVLIAPISDGVSDPDGVMRTAPRGADSVLVGAEAPTAEATPQARTAVTPHDLTTQEQIDRWLSARDTEAQPFEQAEGPGDDRRMHGYVSGAIGTNDFSDVSVGVSLPLGERGRLDLQYSQTRNGYGYGYGYPAYGYGYDAYPADFDPRFGGPGRLGAYDPFFGPGVSRSMSVGLSWDEDKERETREDRGWPGRGRFGAAD